MKHPHIALAVGACTAWFLTLAPARSAQPAKRPGFVNAAPR